jgi:hypothetical protein
MSNQHLTVLAKKRWSKKMFKIIVFVPKKYSEKVKEEMFKAGAGKFKNYDRCSFETEGLGQFRPLKNAKPALGKVNALEKVSELKLEMICPENKIQKVISAMKKAHPYEEVAFDVITLVDINQLKKSGRRKHK